ncbi:MAG: type 1 glutamine amidotransferase domain-containing protein [Opitutales bacterium]
MQDRLSGHKVAVLVADGFEQVELTQPVEALRDAGASVEIVSPVEGAQVHGWNMPVWGDPFPVDRHLGDANPSAYSELLLPGGVLNPDTLRKTPSAVAFVKAFVDADKPIAAICHGPQTLIECDCLNGRKVTSYPSVKTDLINAGALWLDEEVVRDGNFVFSRRPDDLPAFNDGMVRLFAELGATAAVA